MKGLKIIALISFVFLLMFSMIGCANNEVTNKGQSFDQQGAMELNQGKMSERQHPRPDMAHRPRLMVSQEIADAVTQMEGIDAASVMLTDRNAYVAVIVEKDSAYRSHSTDKNWDIQDRIKEDIAKTVRSMNSNVEKVFVSANPDFVDRFNGIVDYMADGRPLQGLVHEFNVLVERIFPENS